MAERKSKKLRALEDQDMATHAQDIVMGALFGAPKKGQSLKKPPSSKKSRQAAGEDEEQVMAEGKTKKASRKAAAETASSATASSIPGDTSIETTAAKGKTPRRVALERNEEAKKARKEAKEAARAAASLGLKVQEWSLIPLEDIDTEDKIFQYRLSSGVADLKESLGTTGQQEPVDLTGKKPYRIIDGFRRIKAARDLGWDSIKAFVHRAITDEEASRLAFTKNVIRKNLSQIEKAHAMLLAQRRGVKKAELAKAFGIAERQVNRYLELNSFPEEVQKMIDGIAVTMTHAKLLVKYGVKDVREWEKRIRKDGMDAKTLKRALKEELGDSKEQGRPKKYIQSVGDSALRFYPFRISKDSSASDKKRVIKLLEDSLEKLRRW